MGKISQSDLTHYFVDSGVAHIVDGADEGYAGVSLIPLPSGFHDAPRLFVEGEWIEDVEGERTRLWSAIKIAREKAIDGGCSTPLGRVDTDPASRAAINQAWGEALADPDGFSRVWTMENNDDEPVDHDAMRAIKLAVDAHVEAQRARARDLRDQLSDANTAAELWAVPPF
jgi:hypothetical protein